MNFCAFFLMVILVNRDAVIQVPIMAAPVMDNEIGQSEWRDAMRISVGDGGEVLLGADAQHVYLALQNMPAGDFGFACLYIFFENKVLVLHASAQLGTAVYRSKDGLWHPDRDDYLWKKADQMWAEEHWKAGVNPRGTQEFIVARHVFGDAPKVAIGYWLVEKDTQRAISWPAQLKDDTQNLKLLSGHNPSGLSFDPGSWARLVWD